MNELKAPSLQSLLESDRGSTDSLLAESLQLDIDDLDDTEYSIPPFEGLPTLESVLTEFDGDSDIGGSEITIPAPTPTPSIADEVARSASGSILRHVVLQGVSAQSASAADRINAGLATAFAVSQMIAVGTSHGHILNFDTAQTLKWAHQDQNSQGAVSALAYNEDCSRLLAGFARGLITMIDTRTGNVLRNLFESITPNTGVLNLKWTGKPALALCSDSGGSVWSLTFTRKLGIRGCASRCLFSGARGEVCCVEPLVLDEPHPELSQYCIVALATLSKYFIVTIRPRLKVIKFHALAGPAGCLPLLSWQMVLIQAADSSRSVDPVLAAARGNQLFFHQILIANGRINLLFLRNVQLGCNLLSLHWLGTKSIACMDTNEMLHLIEVRSSKEQECIDMGGAGLVYNSSQFKGLATGGNVSPALALAGTHACYNSVIARKTQLYVLGARSLHMVSVRNWSERISYLVRNQRWAEACELSIDAYRQAGDRLKRKQQAKDRIIQLYNEYISTANRAPEFCLGPIIKCLIEVNELDLLWQELWDRLNSTGLFLTLLTEHIEKDEITIVSPSISQALVDFWANLLPQRLEDIILKLEWTCLDLNQVLKVAKKKKLFKTQIHLNTKALNDYTVSLTDLIPLIETENRNLGNCLLVYISSCLAGRGYPNGDIPIEFVQHVKHEVLRSLTSLHSNTSEVNELPYPYLRALLKFDTREMLNVISLAFQEKEFNGELGISHRKRIINILMEIMTPDNATWSDIGCLLNFISLQISSGCLPEDPALLDKVFCYLRMEQIEGETTRQHSERESAWLELLSASCLDHIPHKLQVELASKAKCYCVMEYHLEKLKEYGQILDCYLKNPIRHQELFSYVKAQASSPQRKIYEQMYKNFPELLRIDAEQVTGIVADFYVNHTEELVKLLKNEPRLLFTFLNYLIKFGVSLSSENLEIFLDLLCQEHPECVLDFLMSNDNYRIENALQTTKKYDLSSCSMYLYEKQGDYDLAFNLSLELLQEATESTAEQQALQVSSLCSRASRIVTEKLRERYWFDLLKLILSREDFKAITKQMLHEASQHVDLSKLVQLVLHSGTQNGSFGDIKDLISSMLSNSRYETQAMQTMAKILGHDLHEKFVETRKDANRGLWVTFVKCVICRQRLYNQTDVMVLGVCRHAMHIKCYDEINNSATGDEGRLCPRCGTEISNGELISLAEPSFKIGDRNSYTAPSDSSVLNLKAPPRKFEF